jgi:hypothetical protein
MPGQVRVVYRVAAKLGIAAPALRGRSMTWRAQGDLARTEGVLA